MKKFTMGLVLALATLLLWGSSASAEPLNVSLFPCAVAIHDNGQELSYDSSEVTIICREGRAYIPLRAFAESLGMTVNFTAAGEAGEKDKIEIFAPDDRKSTVAPSAYEMNGKALPYDAEISITRNGYMAYINTADTTVLVSDGHTYVPIRAFSNAAGYIVNFSSENGNKIDIYSLNQVTPDAQDEEGYISVYITGITEVPEREFRYYHGLIKVNKDISGKRIEYSSDNLFLSIDGALSQPIKAGQIRSFIAYDRNNFASAFTVVPEWTMEEFNKSIGLKSGFNVVVQNVGWLSSPTIEITSTDAESYYLRYWSDSIQIGNVLSDPIILNSVDITYNINRIDGDTKVNIVSYKLPGFDGAGFDSDRIEIPTGYGPSIYIPKWDLKDAKGNPVPPGKYEIEIVIPSQLKFTINYVDYVEPMNTAISPFEIVVKE